MTDPAAYLEAELARREALARAAACDDIACACGSWNADEMPGEIRDDRNAGTIAAVYRNEYADHIAANDPADVLRRIAADRKLIADLLAERHDVVEDCWYTCAAATEEHDGGETCNDNRLGKACDCGRDERVGRRLRLIAEGAMAGPRNSEHRSNGAVNSRSYRASAAAVVIAPAVSTGGASRASHFVPAVIGAMTRPTGV